jgi:hypothetical protein
MRVRFALPGALLLLLGSYELPKSLYNCAVVGYKSNIFLWLRF